MKYKGVTMKKIYLIFALFITVLAVPAFAANMFESMKNAAEGGDAAARYKLAMEYYGGDYFPKDLKKCAEWCEKSALQGYARAQMHMGVLYTYGEGVSKDLKKAFEWEEKAAAQGLDAAQFGLGGKYLRGEGVSVDSKKAVEWLEKAAGQGNLGALNTLALVYSEGKTAGIPKDVVKAYAYFDVYAKNGGNKDAVSASMNDLLKIMSRSQSDEARKISEGVLGKIRNSEKNRKSNLSAPPPQLNPNDIAKPMKKEKTADVNAAAGDNSSWKTLKLTLMNKKVDDLKQILEKGADLKFTDQNGENCLFKLTGGVTGGDNDIKSAEMAGMLIEKGVDVNAKNKFGHTVLMLAAKQGNAPLMKLLIEKGADVNARSDNGTTALGYARKARQEESVKYLVSLSAAE